MALRPFAFGLRLRDKERTVRIIQDPHGPKRFKVSDSRSGGRARARDHASLGSALRDAASTWRSRLN